jgi:hypothetical protein
VKLFQKAAAQNEASAFPSLAWAYYQGKGIAQDYAEAAKRFRKAADGGDAQSKYMLGYLYEDGKGVAADGNEAAKWYKQPAEKGSTYAQYLLGYLYEDGKGVPQDAVQAYMWSNLAASQLSGEEGGRVSKARDFIASKLAPDQLAKAQELACNWQPKKMNAYQFHSSPQRREGAKKTAQRRAKEIFVRVG